MLFKKLDDYLNKTAIKSENVDLQILYNESSECCLNPEIFNNGLNLTCHSCGTINPHHEDLNNPVFLNPKY